DSLIGAIVGGRYTIQRLIGRGGVGLVYLANKIDSGSPVVIKVLAPDWAQNREVLARFEREVERLSELKHPNIVRMFECGSIEGRNYMVMEYIHGVTLGEYVADKAHLPLEDFVPIVAQILKALGYAHSRGLMHRDIKPSNIRLCERGGRA